MKNNRDLLPIQELFEWSGTSFESGVNPYCIFMDLIGYSEDRYGTHTYHGKDYNQVLGYKELCMLGDALKVFEARGYDEVYQFLDYLEPDAIPSDELVHQWEELGFTPPKELQEVANSEWGKDHLQFISC